jgi:hypothetical protein
MDTIRIETAMLITDAGLRVKISIWNTETRTFGYFTKLRHILWFFWQQKRLGGVSKNAESRGT